MATLPCAASRPPARCAPPPRPPGAPEVAAPGVASRRDRQPRLRSPHQPFFLCVTHFTTYTACRAAVSSGAARANASRSTTKTGGCATCRTPGWANRGAGNAPTTAAFPRPRYSAAATTTEGSCCGLRTGGFRDGGAPATALSKPGPASANITGGPAFSRPWTRFACRATATPTGCYSGGTSMTRGGPATATGAV